MRSIVDRSVRSSCLHEIIEYCVPRRLLRSFWIWAMQDNDALMRLDVTIDYDEHDRQIELAGDGLPDGVAGSYVVGYGRPDAASARQDRHGTCPHVGKAVDLFVKAARDRGLYLTWNVSFLDRHAELYKKFGFTYSGSSTFRDLTREAPSTKMVHSALPELSVSARVSQDLSGSAESGRQDEKQGSQ